MAKPQNRQVTSAHIVNFVQTSLKKCADKEKAPIMAAYMKTDMPFYGVQKPDREPILKVIKSNYRPECLDEYESTIRELWRLPHREEKYIALGYATTFVSIADLKTNRLFEELVREGAWWDFVDVIAGHLTGYLLNKHRKELSPVMDKWIEDPDFWIRRTAILSQLKHKKETDARRLFDYCLRQADEQEFFIRKAIGWALREYSYTDPVAVKRFLVKNRGCLSNLSFREGAKHLIKSGMMEAD